MPSHDDVRIEIAVQDPEGATIAHQEGAARVELCSALGVGGLTPGWGTTKAVVATGIAVHPLIRSRAGGFIYTRDEIAVMVDDMAALGELGCAGFVAGVLTADNEVDEGAMRTLCSAAGSRDVTFHRALDIVADPRRALDLLIDLGVRRVLTSGQAARAGDGLDVLADLVEHANGRIEIQAGGGVQIEDIARLVARGVRDIHLSARTQRSNAGQSGPGGGDPSFDVTDPGLVRAALTAAGGAQG